MEEKRFKPGKTGEISAGPRIMRQLLRTPMFKDLAALSVDAKDPESARELARTLLWEDAAFSFGMLGGLPQDINILLAFLDEIGIQLHHVPPELLQQFVTEMAAKIDREALKALPETYAPLLKTLIWEDAERRAKYKNGWFRGTECLDVHAGRFFERCLHETGRNARIVSGRFSSRPAGPCCGYHVSVQMDGGGGGQG